MAMDQSALLELLDALKGPAPMMWCAAQWRRCSRR